MCVQCGFSSVFTYIISFDSYNNSMGQAGVTAPHVIEKHIETERLRVSSTLTWLESAEMGWGLSTLGPLPFLLHFLDLVHETPG